MAFNPNAWRARSALSGEDPDAVLGAAFDVFDEDRPVLQAQFNAINHNFAAQPNAIPAAERPAADVVLRTKKRMFYELKCFGVVQPARARLLLRSLLVFGLEGVEQLGSLYPDFVALQGVGVPNPDITTTLRMQAEEKKIRDTEKQVLEKSKKKQPVRRIDVQARLEATGLNNQPVSVRPDAEMARVLQLRLEEQRHSSVPFIEIKAEPWLDRNWKLNENAEMASVMSNEEAAEQIIGTQAAEQAARSLMIESAAKMKKMNLPIGLWLAAVTRLVNTAQLCGTIFADNSRAPAAYVGVLLHICCRFGGPTAKSYDTKLREKIGKLGRLTVEQIEQRFIGLDQEVIDEIANEKRLVTVAQETKRRRTDDPRPEPRPTPKQPAPKAPGKPAKNPKGGDKSGKGAGRGAEAKGDPASRAAEEQEG